MRSRDPNPPIPPLLRGAAWIEVAVLLLAGGGLFFLSDAAQVAWPWPIEPFNALFLGAVFLASLAAVGMLVVYPRWAPARLLLPMIFVFTALFLLVSLIYPQRFEFERWATYGWYAVYLGLPAVAVYGLYRYRNLPSPVQYPTPPRWRRLLLANAVIMGLYGFAMFAAPMRLTAFWPWDIDAFHGRLYSVVFTTIAVGGLGLAHFAAPVERLTLGLGYAVLGLFSVFSVFIADASQHAVNWSAPGVWLWLASFGLEFVLGLALIAWSSDQRPVER
jgi:hypothetical protein